MDGKFAPLRKIADLLDEPEVFLWKTEFWRARLHTFGKSLAVTRGASLQASLWQSKRSAVTITTTLIWDHLLNYARSPLH